MRSALYRCYWKLEQVITPGLRSSQYAYYEALDQLTSAAPVWLDLGCGHQVFASWMDREERKVVGQARLVAGMDYDVPSLRSHKTIHMRLAGDVTRLPFPDATFDLVSANMVIEHLNDPAAALLEIRRVLKPGGAFVFHTPNYWNFWVLLGGIAPDFLKLPAIRMLEGRKAVDVFPTRYRMNTGAAITNLARAAGFDVTRVDYLCTSAGTGALGPLSVFELLLIRLLRLPAFSRFRSNIVAVLSKPAGAVRQAA